MNTNDLYSSDNGYVYIDGNYIHETAIVEDNVRIGRGNIIMPYAVIGEVGFIRGVETKGSVIIGDRNRIGCHTSIMAGESEVTAIGDDNLIMNHVNIGHNCTIGNSVEIGAGCILAGFVNVYNDVKIKVGATIRNVNHGTTVKGNPAK
jgi:acyl-[acyl carrier protein]--UDP-N-acetylglucosamine O-acyltransferase